MYISAIVFFFFFQSCKYEHVYFIVCVLFLLSAKNSMRLKNPSADRNCQPILEKLLLILDRTEDGLKLLEISSGTGQHISHFAKHFPNIKFYPSELDASMFGSINAFIQSMPNVCRPMAIDIRTPFGKWDWNVTGLPANGVNGTFDYIININMMHISPWECSEGLFKNASGLLKSNGLIITYGPYALNGILLPESNINFDRYLRSTNAAWGVRDIRDLKQLGDTYGIVLKQTYNMPANNKLCVWKKEKFNEAEF